MTQWTQEQYQELSKNVAEKFGIKPNTGLEYVNEQGQKLGEYKYSGIWLHNNWAFIMEKCDKYKIECQSSHDDMYCTAWSRLTPNSNKYIKVVELSDHNNDSSLAQRVARMLALMEVTL